MRKSIVFVIGLAITSASSVASAARKTILDIAKGNENFSTLVSLVNKAGLDGALADPGARLTVFAPTNAAFGKLNHIALDKLADLDVLTRVLKFHVSPMRFSTRDFLIRKAVPTLVDGFAVSCFVKDNCAFSGGKISIGLQENSKNALRSATIEIEQIQAINGTIFAISNVLLPNKFSSN